MLEHTIFMLENCYVTDTFVCGSCVCLIIALVAFLLAINLAINMDNDGIQSEDKKLIKRCEFWTIISLIGDCILAILNFIILPYSVPIYDRHGLTCNRLMVGSDLVVILLAFVYIRNVIKKLAMID